MQRSEMVVALLDLARGVASGEMDRETVRVGLGDLLSRLDPQLALAPGLAPPPPKPSTAAALRHRAERIVDYWIRRTGRNPKRTLVSDDRVDKVRSILRKGVSDRDAMQAIANAAEDAFYQGENDRGTRYDRIATIFQSVARVEELRDKGDAPIEVEDEKPVEPVEARPRKVIEAELARAEEHRIRAKKGGDRDGFNRWAAECRRLRRELEGSAR
jgi:hypothetical protein